MAVIESRSLRIKRRIIEFVIDTGSLDSYFSQKDVTHLQIPVAGKPSRGVVEFGGSKYTQVSLPKIKMFLLTDDKDSDETVKLDVCISALRTTKQSVKKREGASILPSILGYDSQKRHTLTLRSESVSVSGRPPPHKDTPTLRSGRRSFPGALQAFLARDSCGGDGLLADRGVIPSNIILLNLSSYILFHEESSRLSCD